jgi:hypothetical protein
MAAIEYASQIETKKKADVAEPPQGILPRRLTRQRALQLCWIALYLVVRRLYFYTLRAK